MSSVHIHNSEDKLVVLQDIFKLWITIRGYSMVAAWMEVYKQSEKQTVKNQLDYVNLLVELDQNKLDNIIKMK